MASISFPSASASRFPEEIWLLIFRFATATHWDDFETPFECSSLHTVDLFRVAKIGVVVEPGGIYTGERKVTLALTRGLIQVCRQWRRMAFPLLVECIEVRRPTDLEGWLRILGPGDGDDAKGSLVRTLRALPISFEERDSLAWDTELSRALKTFKGLREFSWRNNLAPKHIMAPLAERYGERMTSINVHGHPLRLDELATLLRACPSLKSLHFNGPRYDATLSETLPINSGIQNARLTTLFWDVSSMKVGVPAFLASLTLPALCRLGIYLVGTETDDDGYDLDVDGVTLFEYLKPMFLSYGEQIRWLSVDEHYHDGNRMDIRGFLHLCPRLEELHFDLCTSEFHSNGLHHTFLRNIIPGYLLRPA